MKPHISLAAETVFKIAGFPVTNSLLTTWLVMVILISVSWLASRRRELIPKNHFQMVIELIVSGLYALFESVVGEQQIKKFFPLLATLFIYILLANWLGLLPGVGTIFVKQDANQRSVKHTLINSIFANETIVNDSETTNTEQVKTPPPAEVHSRQVPLFRGPTADLNTTLGLGIIAMLATVYYGIGTLGLGFFKRYLNITNPIMFFIGILEIISDLSKIISFAFRLFGNIFAGEVLLTVISSLIAFVAPIPFYGLELFVGVIQALVFAMLTAVFLSVATQAHDH